MSAMVREIHNLCIGKEVIFKVDYTVSTINREFGSVFIGDTNVALMGQGSGAGPTERRSKSFLIRLATPQTTSQGKGLGRWSQVPGATEAAVRKLPASAVHEPESFDAKTLLSEKKGKPLEAIVHTVSNCPHGLYRKYYLLLSTSRISVRPSFRCESSSISILINAPFAGRRSTTTTTVVSVANAQNGDHKVAEANAIMATAQRVAAPAFSASTTEYIPDPFGREVKHFTEIRVLHKDVRIVLESVDDYRNLIDSVYYPDSFKRCVQLHIQTQKLCSQCYRNLGSKILHF